MSTKKNSQFSILNSQFLKKAGKYSILLSIKEIYLLSRNLLGLIFHPFKTLRVIQRERDYSQAFLIFGLPFYTFLTGIVFIISVRWLIKSPNPWGWAAKSLLSLLSLASLFMFMYLSYWLIKVQSSKFTCPQSLRSKRCRREVQNDN